MGTTYSLSCTFSVLQLLCASNAATSNHEILTIKIYNFDQSCTATVSYREDKFGQAVGGRPPRYAPAPLLPRGHRSAFRRRADGNVAAVSHGQHVLTPTAAVAWHANTAVSKAAWWPWPGVRTCWPWETAATLPSDLESGVRVRCHVS